MVYAQILNGIIQNIIVLNDESLISVFTDGYDHCIRIDNITDNNGDNIILGSTTYDGTQFIGANNG